MAEDIPEALENELAFLETAEQFLENPSEDNWTQFYPFFKAVFGSVPYLESGQAEARQAASTRPRLRLQRFASFAESPLVLVLTGVALLLLVFILGNVLGRTVFGTAATTTSLKLISNSASAGNTAQTSLPYRWQPISQTFQGIEMVLVPAGCWNMGDIPSTAASRPMQQHCIDKPFWIDRTEVTNATYGSIGNPTCADDPGSSAPNLPRSCVNWHEAMTFCQTRSERLPTEAEWEWAARGPNDLLYPWGNQFDVTKAIVVHNVDYPTHAAPVGTDPSGASWVGALDMSGNLWDWTSSIYDPARFVYPYSSNDGRENIADATSERVLRGGSWNDGDEEATTTYRGHARPDIQTETFGFRCVRDVDK